jgi:peptidoglycan/xylan/chitin deacetylase (PgdA/CDA1 family)
MGFASRVRERTLALHSGPSGIAFSGLGPRVTPRLCGIGRAGHLALTYDDGPDPVATPAVLDALAGLGWRATFFVVGEMVERHPEVLRRVLDAGHEVGIHAQRHRNHRGMTPRAIAADVRTAHAAAVAAGATPVWYRPPHGALTPEALLAARRLGMRPVLWTAWGRDWRAAATPEGIRDEVERGRLDGGTVLLHDADHASEPGCWRPSVAALPLLAEVIAARGLTVGPLGEHGLA